MSTSEIILTILLLLALWIVHKSKDNRESFQVAANENIPRTNSGPEPWNHHPVDSVAMDQRVKYEKMYMVELDNISYEKQLNKALNVDNDAKKSNVWIVLDTSNQLHTSFMLIAYTQLLAHITASVSNTEYMNVTYDNPEHRAKIQVVHDVLITFKKHTKSDFTYLITLEAILYREHKFHGKHVQIEAIVTYDTMRNVWKNTITSAKVVGIVYEDTIGFHPVIPFTKVDVIQSSYETLDQPILLSNEEVVTIMKQQNKLQTGSINTDGALLQT